MGISDDINFIKQDIEERKAKEVATLQEEEAKNSKKKKFRLKGKVKSKAKKEMKAGKTLAVILRKNKTIDFKWVENFGGIVQYGPYSFSMYEMGAIYSYENKFPVIVIPEWRLLPVGGVVENAELEGKISIPAKLFGGEADILVSDKLNIGDAAQQTIIRAVEKKEADLSTKKKGNFGWILWLGIGCVALYLIGKLIGWF